MAGSWGPVGSHRVPQPQQRRALIPGAVQGPEGRRLGMWVGDIGGRNVPSAWGSNFYTEALLNDQVPSVAEWWCNSLTQDNVFRDVYIVYCPT